MKNIYIYIYIYIYLLKKKENTIKERRAYDLYLIIYSFYSKNTFHKEFVKQILKNHHFFKCNIQNSEFLFYLVFILTSGIIQYLSL